MNTLLARVDHSTSIVSRMFNDYSRLFREKASKFRGVRRTYTPREGYPEDPTKMGTVVVANTVDEKMNELTQGLSGWLKDVFSVEASNSAGARKVELTVEGHSFGSLTALDLMRLRSILTNKELESVFSNIPTRTDTEVWSRTDDEEYAGRTVFETAMVSGTTRTSETEEEILKDPNLDPSHLPSNYCAKTTLRRRTYETGDYTSQNFSGEWSSRQKEELLRRRGRILSAVVEALKDVNDCEAVPSHLDVEQMVGYLVRG